MPNPSVIRDSNDIDLLNSPNTTQNKTTGMRSTVRASTGSTSTNEEKAMENGNLMSNAEGTENAQHLPHLMTPYSLGHNSNLDDTFILQRLLNSGGPNNVSNLAPPATGNRNITDFNTRPSSVFQWDKISNDFLLSSPDHIRDVLQQSISNHPPFSNNGSLNNNNNNNSNFFNTDSPVSNMLNSLFKTPAKSTLGNNPNSRMINNSGFSMWNLNSTIKKLTPLKFFNESNKKMDPLLLQTNDIKIESTALNNNKSNEDSMKEVENTIQGNNVLHGPTDLQSFIPVTSYTGEAVTIPNIGNMSHPLSIQYQHRSLVCASPSVNRVKQPNLKRKALEPIDNVLSNISDNTVLQVMDPSSSKPAAQNKRKPGLKKKRKLNSTTTSLPDFSQTMKKSTFTNNTFANNTFDQNDKESIENEANYFNKTISKKQASHQSGQPAGVPSNNTTATEDDINSQEDDLDACTDINSSQATIDLDGSASKPREVEFSNTSDKTFMKVTVNKLNTSPTPKFKKKTGNVLPKLRRTVSSAGSSGNNNNNNNNNNSNKRISSVPELPKMGSFSNGHGSTTFSAGQEGIGNLQYLPQKKQGNKRITSLPINHQSHSSSNGKPMHSNKKRRSSASGHPNTHSNNNNSNNNSNNNGTSHNKSFQIVFTDPNLFESCNTSSSTLVNTSFNSSMNHGTHHHHHHHHHHNSSFSTMNTPIHSTSSRVSSSNKKFKKQKNSLKRSKSENIKFVQRK